MIYLAVPYTHPYEEMRAARFRTVTRFAADLLKQGHVVFSPITHSHPLEVLGDLPNGWEFWQTQDIEFLKLADELHVLCLEGWKESTGVQGEIDWWTRNRRTPIVYHEYDADPFAHPEEDR